MYEKHFSGTSSRCSITSISQVAPTQLHFEEQLEQQVQSIHRHGMSVEQGSCRQTLESFGSGSYSAEKIYLIILRN